MTAALEVSGLSKSFGGVAAVKGIEFSVNAGEAVALIGPNGAGKTTSFNLINGQIVPDAGRVSLNGVDITGKSPESLFHMGVARTFQVTATFGSMTVCENVQMALMSRYRFTCRVARGAYHAFEANAYALLADVGMAELAHRAASLLAYGDLKRLELAMAFANEPRLLLMDEPTAGMAPVERDALMRLAIAACRRQNIALLFTEHDMDIVFGFADRVIVMNRGRIIASGTPDEVRENEEVRAVYLGGMITPKESTHA